MYDRIKRCINILNKIKPDWTKNIKWRCLDLQNPYWCILGQIFGNYDKGLKAFKNGGYDDLTPWLYGVSLKHDEINEKNWNELHDCWIDVLKIILPKEKKWTHKKKPRHKRKRVKWTV